MYPIASSQMASRPDERRQNPRHTASAIVYVHLGPDNGGIIINLGIGGVACQAARKLIAKKNTSLNVRLRGSGLDVNLVGEIIWQGASQKEIGICFKDPPASQQQEIANWIARQEQASKAPPVDDFAPPKPMPGMPEVFTPGVGYVPRSFSAAFPMPQTKPADPPSGAVEGAIDSHLPAPVDSAGGIFAATPRLEVVSRSKIGMFPLKTWPPIRKDAAPIHLVRQNHPGPFRLCTSSRFLRSFQSSAHTRFPPATRPPLFSPRSQSPTYSRLYRRPPRKTQARPNFAKREKSSQSPRIEFLRGRKVCSKPPRRTNGFPRRFLPYGGEGAPSTSYC